MRRVPRRNSESLAIETSRATPGNASLHHKTLRLSPAFLCVLCVKSFLPAQNKLRRRRRSTTKTTTPRDRRVRLLTLLFHYFGLAEKGCVGPHLSSVMNFDSGLKTKYRTLLSWAFPATPSKFQTSAKETCASTSTTNGVLDPPLSCT